MLKVCSAQSRTVATHLLDSLSSLHTHLRPHRKKDRVKKLTENSNSTSSAMFALLLSREVTVQLIRSHLEAQQLRNEESSSGKCVFSSRLPARALKHLVAVLATHMARKSAALSSSSSSSSSSSARHSFLEELTELFGLMFELFEDSLNQETEAREEEKAKVDGTQKSNTNSSALSSNPFSPKKKRKKSSDGEIAEGEGEEKEKEKDFADEHDSSSDNYQSAEENDDQDSNSSSDDESLRHDDEAREKVDAIHSVRRHVLELLCELFLALRKLYGLTSAANHEKRIEVIR